MNKVLKLLKQLYKDKKINSQQYSPFYWTRPLLICSHKQKERLMTMYQMRYVRGHVQVYDVRGNFLFSADNEKEAREELEEYAESAA